MTHGFFEDPPVTTDAIFEKGKDAVERQNYGYAIELLGSVVAHEPKNVKARQLLWLAERRKFAADPNAAKTARFKTIAPWVASVIHSMMGKHDLVVADCERYLTLNPENAAMRDQLGKAALQAGDMDLAIAAYESAREVDSKNGAALRQLGRLYKIKLAESGRREDLNLAMARFEELLRLKPMDHEAKSETQRLAAQRAIEDGGWHEAEGARDLIRDKDKAAELEQDQKIVKGEDEADRELARLADQIKAEPGRANLLVRQGELLLQKKRFKSAEESFRKAHAIDANNTFIRSRLGEVKIQFMRSQLEALEEQSDKKPADTALKGQVLALRKQLNDFMVEEYRKRVAEQPTDMEVHQQLGLLLLKNGDSDGAMQMFQKSVADPRYRMTANHMLGKCLVDKQMYDRAVNMFKRAVEGVVVMNHTVKGVYYDLGDTYEKMGQFKDAEAAYGKIYDADVSYRDVAKKMEEVYKKAREKGEGPSAGAPHK